MARIKDSSDYKEINKYVKIINDLNHNNEFSYSKLCDELLINFGIKIALEELIKINEPTIEEEVEDLEMQYRNVL